MKELVNKKVEILDELELICSYLSVIKNALSNSEYSDTDDIAIILGDVIQRINKVHTMIDL